MSDDVLGDAFRAFGQHVIALGLDEPRPRLSVIDDAIRKSGRFVEVFSHGGANSCFQPFACGNEGYLSSAKARASTWVSVIPFSFT